MCRSYQGGYSSRRLYPAVLALLLSLLLLAGCGDKSDSSPEGYSASVSSEHETTPQGAEHLSSQSGNVVLTSSGSNVGWQQHLLFQPQAFISAAEPLRFVFSHPVSGKHSLQKTVDGVVKIEPEAKFRSYFDSDRSVVVEFLTPLDRDATYQFSLLPNKLSGLSDNLSPYQFRSGVFRQDFSVQINGLVIPSGSASQPPATVTGSLTTNDIAAPEQLHAVLSAVQGDKTKQITWTAESPTKHHFTVEGISRGEQASTVSLRWNGEPIGSAEKGEKVIHIPALSSFELTGVIGHQHSDQFIELHFSDTLDRTQSHQGLIKINGKNPKNTRVDGNRLRVYPRRKLVGDVTLSLAAGIKSSRHVRTTEDYVEKLTFLSALPGVRFSGHKHILPKGDNLKTTIEAVNVNSVQITAYRMPINNLGQFLQHSTLQKSYSDADTSVIEWRKTYQLPSIPRDRWQKFEVDLGKITQDFGNDLLGLSLKINQSHVALDCGVESSAHDDSINEELWPTDSDNEPSWVRKYYQTQGVYVYRDQDNPCKPTYYNYYGRKNTSAFRYFTTSSLGVIAKMAPDHQVRAVVTDINSAAPIKGATVKVFNFQHQPVGEAVTDAQGMAVFTPDSTPHYLITTYKQSSGKLDIGFLKLVRNEALSTNIFDVGGEATSNGLKGFFYGERGVWRPGDDIFLNFILLDKTGNFPKNHPLTLDFFDAKGTKHQSVTQTNPINGFYHFKLSTDKNAPTGNWRAIIRYGNQHFDKIIPVETIVPNRLKIELNFPDQLRQGDDNKSPNIGLVANNKSLPVELFSQWLNGAPANRLKADVKLRVSATKTRVAGFDSYVFDDPSRALKTEPRNIFNGNLNESGHASFKFSPRINDAPGSVKLNFTTRVFEKSGNFSTQYQQQKYTPYTQLVGVNIPQGSGWNGAISRQDNHRISFLSVTPSGERKANTPLSFSLYKIDWRWWWDYSNDNVGHYLASNHHKALVNTALTTDKTGQASWLLEGGAYDWGRYLLRVCDEKSKHCAGKVVYLGWSYDSDNTASGETQLILSTDKKQYAVGETAWLTIPQILPSPPTQPGDNVDSPPVRMLLTLETGSGIISQRWVDEEIKNNRLPIPVNAQMAPNVYAHLTLIQGYEGKKNDSPVRLYGIAPIMVTNSQSKLTPVIAAKGTVRPQSTMALEVSEKSGRAMTYTLAVVDEGLLGVTNYKTPNPHHYFFRREALGVLTWDMYDMVARSHANTLGLITLGGSDKGGSDGAKKHKRRFPPVVKFLGPFSLPAGETKSHQVTLPEYMGAVRVMVVAANIAGNSKKDEKTTGIAFGTAEKTIKVTQPLTLLATLPRVLGPNETFDLPLSVFASEPSIKDVTLSVKTNGLLQMVGEPPAITFSAVGEKIVTIPFKTVGAVGQGSVTVTAVSGAETMSQTVHIPVRSANEPQLISSSAVVPAGQKQLLQVTPNGMLNTNSAYFEVSRVPNINLAERLNSLISYPHGCLEQTTSKLFPQLFLKNLLPLSPSELSDTDHYVKEGIAKLQRFQNTSGAFNYWPNGDYHNQWSNSYAGHFLLEAKRLGYAVPIDVLNHWINWQQQFANGWSQSTSKHRNKNGGFATQAYTLYTLVLANKADFSAMNRLREQLSIVKEKQQQETSNQQLARWLLAASYARSGAVTAAKELLAMGINIPRAYDGSGYTYGSLLRDHAVLMLAQTELRKLTKDAASEAWSSALSIAKRYKRERWVSTQTSAWALLALGNYFSDTSLATGGSQPLSYRLNGGEWQNISLLSPWLKQTLPEGNTPISLEIKNESKGELFAVLGNRGTPPNQQEKAVSNQLSMAIKYTDMQGRPLEVAQLPQGEDFKALVTVDALDSRTRLENLALTMTMPSGWQISNERLEGGKLAKGLEYQDIRDDRVLSYFTLGRYYSYHRNPNRSISIEVTLNASFTGRFYLPGWHVAAMYDEGIEARSAGRWVKVVPALPVK